MSRDGYLSCTETAKLVRKALKTAFPGTKFSVRSDSYSGGASIRVSYTDGPPTKAVEKVAKLFSGAGFDGMIDMKYHYDHWLMPDGSVQVAYSPGTEGSRGSVPGVMTDPPSPNAKLVHFGADYVLVSRDLSDGFKARIEQALAATYAEFKNGYDGNARVGGMWGSDVFWRVSSVTDADGEIVTDWYQAATAR